MRPRTAAIVLVLAAATTACGTSSSATPNPGQTSKRVSAKPAAEPKRDTGPFAIGHAFTWHDAEPPASSGTTTVIGYEQPVKAGTSAELDTGQKGYVWSALEVKVCLTKGGDTTVSNMPWSLAYEDDARVNPSGTTYGDFPKPEYPITDTALKRGDCIRGKIVFPVPGDQRPERALYSPATGDVGEWRVPEK